MCIELTRPVKEMPLLTARDVLKVLESNFNEKCYVSQGDVCFIQLLRDNIL